MLTTPSRSLDVSAGLTNGAKVAVTTIMPYALQVSTLKDGELLFIRFLVQQFHSWHGKVWTDVKRVQFPIRLCFAVTVHRSQGQTLNRAVFDLRRDVFMHGCLHVGLSRARISANIVVLTINNEDRMCPSKLCAKAVNVVYPSLLPELVYLQ